MSIDEKYENDLASALENVNNMPWRDQRVRILKTSVVGILRALDIAAVRMLSPTNAEFSLRACRACGCTAIECSQCVERTGKPCHWVEYDLCSACRDNPQPAN
jgi:hypothetical protein